MQSIQKQTKSSQKTISSWIVLSLTVFTAVLVNAVIVLGLVRMSGTLQIAVIVATILLIGLGALFSVVELTKAADRTASLAIDSGEISTGMPSSAVTTKGTFDSLK